MKGTPETRERKLKAGEAEGVEGDKPYEKRMGSFGICATWRCSVIAAGRPKAISYKECESLEEFLKKALLKAGRVNGACSKENMLKAE